MSGNDLQALQGRWKVTYLEVAGAKVPAGMFANAEIRVTGDLFESTGMGAVYKGRMTLDGAGHRTTFSLKFEDGPEKGNVNHALYELKGDDWTICLDMKGGPAPIGLVSTPANGYALESLTRVT
ncbi:MAG TPA: TIGR03067 domain-containing protein [Hyphomonadaceae bacterium]|nr:TIGR03067 domain-containing protein [Hyphomonadaceae bacterium]